MLTVQKSVIPPLTFDVQYAVGHPVADLLLHVIEVRDVFRLENKLF